ncbi:MAG: TPM domain-containing protein [Sideroxyarcus sp.]|nr:TPM domain-containing protein [Sideroxyarcus sp.]
MNLKRIIKHLSLSHAAMRRIFPRTALNNIERTIAEVELTHAGQIRFAVEDALDIKPLMAGQSARERAIEVFSQLRVWDTEHNNGVLIYLLLADRDVEIVADRGVHARLGQAVWEAVCQEMEAAFRQGKFEEGVIAGIRSVGRHLAQHYPPADGSKINELPDRPVLI